ncbi:MAG: hypothetical protein WC121_11785 [Candidatus Kapaibacterium sp.]
MADYYVQSGATGSANGSSWANAYTAIEGGAEAVSGAGNRLFLADGHVETHSSANVTLALGGSAATGGVDVLSVNDTGDPTPPTALSAGAKIQTTGAYTLTVGGCGRLVGVHLKAGDGASTNSIVIGSSANNALTLDGCTLEIGSTSASSFVSVGASSTLNSRFRLSNCSFVGSHVSNTFRLRTSRIDIDGGSLSGALFTRAFAVNGSYPSIVTVTGTDLSACATNVVLVDVVMEGSGGEATLIGCTLPTGWSGTPTNAALPPQTRVDVIDCVAGTTRYRRWTVTAFGTIRDTIQLGESIYTTAGTYDGVARYSYKFAAGSNADTRAGQLVGPEMAGYAETAAASTATVEICHDGASALTDQDVWLEVFVDGEWVSDRNANPLSAGTAQATSATAWTGDSGTGPNGSATWHTLKLVCSFTPSAVGQVMGRVVLGKASTTVYVDPVMTVAAA